MTLLPPLDRGDLAPEHSPVWDEIEAYGPVAPKLRVIAHHPVVLQAYWRLGVVLNEDVGLDPPTMNLLVLRTSVLDENAYGWRQRVPKALAAGLSRAKIDELATWENSAAFSPAERALLAFADGVAAGGALPEAVTAAMTFHYPPRTVLAVTILVLFYGLSHRIVDVLEVNPASDNVDEPLPWERIANADGLGGHTTTADKAASGGSPELPPLLPLLERDDFGLEHLPIWDSIAARAPLAPMLKVLAHHPKVLDAYWQLGVAVNDHAGIPTFTVHLLSLRTCQLDRSEYGWAQRLRKARTDGIDEDKLRDLEDWRSSSAFDESERLLLGFTEHLVDGTKFGVDSRQELIRRFEPRTLVGVIMLVLYYVMNHRYVEVMRIRPAQS